MLALTALANDSAGRGLPFTGFTWSAFGSATVSNNGAMVAWAIALGITTAAAVKPVDDGVTDPFGLVVAEPVRDGIMKSARTLTRHWADPSSRR
jgi:hypothetical protein